MLIMELQNFIFVLAEFRFCFGLIPFYFHISLFQKANICLLPFMSVVLNFLLDFYQGLELKVSFESNETLNLEVSAILNY